MKHKYVVLILIIIPTIALSFFQLYNRNRINSWEYVVEKQIQQYPGLEPQDIYKIIYEGLFGIYSDDCSRNSIYNKLKTQYDGIYADPSYQLLEQISPDDKFIRINLRKYKDCRGDILFLSEILYQSQKNFSLIKLKSTLNEVTNNIKNGKIDYNRLKWLEYYQTLQEHNFPTPEHSSFYIDFFNPAYVVVEKEIWDQKTRGMFD